MEHHPPAEPPPVVALLDPPETDSQVAGRLVLRDSTHPRGSAEVFRHSGWQRYRSLILQSLKRTHASNARILNFDSCGYGAYILRDPENPENLRVAGSTCHDRWCRPCGQYRSAKLTAAIQDVVRDKPVRFVTLTLRADGRPLKERLTRLYDSFAKLRRRVLWSKRVFGGGAFCEIVWNPDHSNWHTHLHVLCRGRWLPQQQLSQVWHEITGDSYVVDVRLARTASDLARYVAKYVTKPHTSSFVHDATRLDEAVRALHGRKLCLTFGDWRGIRLTANEEFERWESLGSFDVIFNSALHGDEEAVSIMKIVAPALYESAARLWHPSRSPPTSCRLSSDHDQYLLNTNVNQVSA